MKCFVIAGAVLTVAMASAQELPVRELTAETASARMTAYRNISDRQNRLVEELISVVKTNTSTDYDGGKSLAIRLLGELRAEPAVRVLLQNLTFAPHRRIQEETIPTQAFYVAAASLVSIGNLAVPDVTARMGTVENKLEAELCTWILMEILGKEATLQTLARLEQSPDKREARRGAELKDYLIKFKNTFTPPGTQ